MRNYQEPEHTPCDNVLGEIANCSIFYFDEHCPDEDEPDEDDGCRLQPGEFAVMNDMCQDDPLILTRAELRRLGEQLIEMADEKTD